MSFWKKKKKKETLNTLLHVHLTWMTSWRSVNIKTYRSLHIPLKAGGLFWSHRNPFFKHHSTYLIFSNKERWMYGYESFVVYTFSLLLLFRQASIAVWTSFRMILKSWWRSSKSKRLTLILHQNKSSNLDYFVFLLFFIQSDLDPYLLPYIYIYNYIIYIILYIYIILFYIIFSIRSEEVLLIFLVFLIWCL